MKSDLFEMITKRKSIRKYDLAPLEEGTILEIKAFIKELEPLYKDIKTEISIVSNEGVNVYLPVKSPHYLVMTSENKEGYLTNVGYMLQQMDLFLSSRGIGSCYVGMAQPTKEVKKTFTLEYVIVLAFGKPLESLHRASVSEFKRKPLGEITNIIGMGELLEPVRLAPSATNSQPWYFSVDKNKINIYCFKANFIKAIAYGKMNKIDMGIALCHLSLAAANSGKNLEFVTSNTAQEQCPKGYYYINTAILT